MQKPQAERSPSVNHLKAGLLWSLLGPQGRRVVGRSLSVQELSSLNLAGASFRQADRKSRHAIARSVNAMLRDEGVRYSGRAVLMLLSAATAAIAYYWYSHPKWPFPAILSFASPLLVAAISPVALRLLSRSRREATFQVRFSPVLALYILPSFVSLLWLLFWVNEDAVPARLAGLELGALLVAGALGPLLEEIVFREVIPSAPGPSLLPVGHAVSALLFALMHAPSSGSQFLYYLMAATTLSLLRVLSGGLFWPIAVHALANVVSLIVISA